MPIFLSHPSLMAALVALVAGCAEPRARACRPAAADCPIGADGCRCTEGGACDAGLACARGVCQPDSPATTGATDDHDDTDSGEDTGAADLPECTPPVYWRR